MTHKKIVGEDVISTFKLSDTLFIAMAKDQIERNTLNQLFKVYLYNTETKSQSTTNYLLSFSEAMITMNRRITTNLEERWIHKMFPNKNNFSTDVQTFHLKVSNLEHSIKSIIFDLENNFINKKLTKEKIKSMKEKLNDNLIYNTYS